MKQVHLVDFSRNPNEIRNGHSVYETYADACNVVTERIRYEGWYILNDWNDWNDHWWEVINDEGETFTISVETLIL